MVMISCGGTQVAGEQRAAHEPYADASPMAVGSGQDAAAKMDQPPATSAYTIELINKGDSELMVSVRKGWQPVVFALQGKPPKATAFMLFPKHCMQSCDIAAAQMCPVCEVNEKNVVKRRKQELAQKKDVSAPPGGTITIPWDGHFYDYQLAPAEARTRKNSTCQCYQPADPAPGVYQFWVTGRRRQTKKFGKPARMSRLIQSVTLPLPAGTTTISFEVK